MHSRRGSRPIPLAMPRLRDADAAVLGPRCRPARAETQPAPGRRGSCSRPRSRSRRAERRRFARAHASPRRRQARQRRRSDQARRSPQGRRRQHRRRFPRTAPTMRRSTPVYPATSTGRRLALARWITDPREPARRPGWRSTRSGCGTSGRRWSRPCSTSAATASRPRIPRCSTGWPCSCGIEGWQMKPIHRLIVTSALYRMESTSDGPDRPEPGARPGEYLLLADEPQAHGSRGRARQRASAWRATSTCTLGGPDLDPEAGLEIAAPQPVFPPRQGEAGDVPAAV